jgi:hypothetical protein
MLSRRGNVSQKFQKDKGLWAEAYGLGRNYAIFIDNDGRLFPALEENRA